MREVAQTHGSDHAVSVAGRTREIGRKLILMKLVCGMLHLQESSSIMYNPVACWRHHHVRHHVVHSQQRRARIRLVIFSPPRRYIGPNSLVRFDYATLFLVILVTSVAIQRPTPRPVPAVRFIHVGPFIDVQDCSRASGVLQRSRCLLCCMLRDRMAGQITR